MNLPAVLAEIDRAFETEQIPWLEALVNQPGHTAAPDDVEAVAHMIETRLRMLDLQVEHISSEHFADHRVYSTPATAPTDKTLLLAGHCDTVYARSQGFLTFEREGNGRGDVIHGPGVLDMKSGLTVAIFALQALHHAAPEFYRRLKLRFVCNTDEEVGSPGSRPLYDRLAKLSTAALVFEGGREEDQIITDRKGTGGFRLEVRGREAHAGNQHAHGINAIHAIALLVPRLEQLTDYTAGTTVNVGTIRGGNAKNTVPGSAAIDIDVRITTAQAGRQFEAALHELVDRPFQDLPGLPAKFAEAAVTLTGSIRRWPMESTPASEALRERYEHAAAAEALGTGRAPLQGGGSDANLLAAQGVPCIDGLGPYGQFMHSPKEWSSLASLQKRTRALARFIFDSGSARF